MVYRWKYFNDEERFINGRTKIKFKDWKALYEISPQNYILNIDSLKYDNNNTYQLLFGFFDYCKYLFYYDYINKKEKHNEAKKEKIKEDKILLKIIEDTKKEIEKLETQSNEEVNGFYNFLKEEMKREGKI